MRDITEARSEAEYWISDANKNLYIWKLSKKNDKDTDIGWTVQSGLLRRITGLYDRNKRSWKKKKSDLVAVNVENIEFLFHAVRSRMKSVSFKIVFPSDQLTGTIALRNRIIINKLKINDYHDS